MIEIPIVKPPDVLQDLLNEFRPLFNRRSYRQFCRYITALWATPTRSVAHLNGNSVEHTNQSNLNRFLRNIPTLQIFGKSVDLINRYASDPVMIIDDTILARSGKHIDGADWFFDHSRGKSVWGMQFVTYAISCSEGIFPLNVDQKVRFKISKMVMQMTAIKRAITAGLKFSTVLMDSWYFGSRLIRFLEKDKKDWVTEAKSNRFILVGNEWVGLEDFSRSMNVRDMTAYMVDGKSYFMKSITTWKKNVGKVQVIVSRGIDSEKFFVTNRTDWNPRKVINLYLRRWDIEQSHREVKQDGLRHLYQRTHESLLGTAKLSPLGELLLEISAIRSLGSRMKLGKSTLELRYRVMAMRILMELFVMLEEKGQKLLDVILESIRKPYKSTIGVMGG